MAVQVMNASGQAGYVHLVFDRDIDVDLLRLAICNRISRTYLGHSVGKANWSPARSHFFDAVLVSRGNGETVFKVGPEATTFIPDETTVELTSDDGIIREVAVWRSILLDFHWVAPEDDAKGLQEENDRRHEAERRLRTIEMERQRQEAEDAKRQVEAKAAEEEKVRRQAEAARQRQEAEKERNRIETEKAKAETTRKAEAERQRKEDEEENNKANAAEAEEARKQAEADKQWKESAEEQRKRAEAAMDLALQIAGDKTRPPEAAKEITGRLFATVLILALILFLVDASRRWYQFQGSSQALKEIPHNAPHPNPKYARFVLTYNGPVSLNLHMKCSGGEVSFERYETFGACGGYPKGIQMSDGQELQFHDLPAGEYEVIVVTTGIFPRGRFPANVLFDVSIELDAYVYKFSGGFTGVANTKGGDSRHVYSFLVSNS